MYCIFARESIEKMGGNRGKLAAMAGHAFLGAFLDAENGRRTNEDSLAYRVEYGMPKIVCVVDTVEDLRQIHREMFGNFGCMLVTDAAKTVFSEPTDVCLGVGPCPEGFKGLEHLKVLL